MQGLDSLFVAGFGCKIFGFIRVGNDIVKLEGFGLKDVFHFSGSAFIGLGLFHPFRPGLGKELSFGIEICLLFLLLIKKALPAQNKTLKILD